MPAVKMLIRSMRCRRYDARDLAGLGVHFSDSGVAGRLFYGRFFGGLLYEQVDGDVAAMVS